MTEVEEWSHQTRRWRRIHNFKVHAIAEEIQKAEDDIQSCVDDIYLLEKDVRVDEVGC